MQQHRSWIRRIGLLAVAAIALAAGFAGYHWWEGWQQTRLRAGCIKAQRSHRWEELEQLSEEWCRRQPQSADALIFRADAAQQLGSFKSAAEFLTAVPATDPKSLVATIALAELQFGPLDQPLEGEKTCERILAQEPKVTTAHRLLIRFYAATLQREKLIRQIRAAIAVSRESPTDYVYLFLIDSMRVGDASELNLRWLHAYPQNELFEVAAVLQLPEPMAGNGAEDEDKYRQVAEILERFPDNIELLAYTIDVAVRHGDAKQVVKLLKRIQSSEVNDARFWRAKGWLHLSRGELEKARDALEQALRLSPLDWNARSWLADVERGERNLVTADKLQSQVKLAHKLRTELITIDETGDVPRSALKELQRYAAECGDEAFAKSLGQRVSSDQDSKSP